MSTIIVCESCTWEGHASWLHDRCDYCNEVCHGGYCDDCDTDESHESCPRCGSDDLTEEAVA